MEALASIVSISHTCAASFPAAAASAPGELEHARDVLAVSLADLCRARVVAEVVVAIGQAQAALRDLREVSSGVLGIGSHRESEPRIDAMLVQVGEGRGEPRGIDHGVGASERRGKRLETRLVDPGSVHPARVEARHLALRRRCRGRRAHRLVQCRDEDLRVAFVQLVECAPAWPVLRDLDAVEPPLVGVTVEVGAGIGVPIEPGDVEGGGSRAGRQRRGDGERARAGDVASRKDSAMKVKGRF
jgi:hypothetical protein